MPMLPFFLLLLAVMLLALAYHSWFQRQSARPSCVDGDQRRGVEVSVLHIGLHRQTELLLCPFCADRRDRMAQSLTKGEVHG